MAAITAQSDGNGFSPNRSIVRLAYLVHIVECEIDTSKVEFM